MNRQIKFRAWNYAARNWQTEWTGMNLNGEILSLMPDKQYALNKDVAIVFQQFTGLLDKNGKEIYEGDIVKYLPHYPADFQERNPHKKHGRILGPVVWIDGWLYADLKKDNNVEDILLYKECAGEFEIVGNIYENGDLLK